MKIRKKAYVLVLKHNPKKPERRVFWTYQQALANYATTRGTVILNDEDWPKVEGWLNSDPYAELHKAKLTVEF